MARRTGALAGQGGASADGAADDGPIITETVSRRRRDGGASGGRSEQHRSAELLTRLSRLSRTQ